MKTVGQILAAKPQAFNIIHPDATVYDALMLMRSVNLHYVIVMKDTAFLGIMSEHDYSQKIILQGKHSCEVKVAEIMTHDMPFVGLDDKAEKCMLLMDVFKTLYLPAFEGSSYMGVITMDDLLKESMFEYNTADKELPVRSNHINTPLLQHFSI
ncbi:MAG: CBS domain-containing protein [Bacteroidota bacterium]|nr:CBS domain-containing protein [Bacteroidota bacterium]